MQIVYLCYCDAKLKILYILVMYILFMNILVSVICCQRFLLHVFFFNKYQIRWLICCPSRSDGSGRWPNVAGFLKKSPLSRVYALILRAARSLLPSFLCELVLICVCDLRLGQQPLRRWCQFQGGVGKR